LGYFVSREQIFQLLIGYGLLFLNYLYLIRSHISPYYSLIFRLILLFSVPALSDDFYRFVFDGRLLSNGVNPYLILPSEFVKSSDYQLVINDISIFKNLNSPNYYTVYPPLNQFIFGVSSLFSNQNLLINIIILRLFIIASEFGSIWLILRLFTPPFQAELSSSIFLKFPPLFSRGGVPDEVGTEGSNKVKFGKKGSFTLFEPPRPTSSGHPSLKKGGEILEPINPAFQGWAVYAFNPLVILELTGNLHFEAIMIFFGLLAVYLLIQKKYIFSAISLAFGVSIKLLPLIFIPLIIKYLGVKKGIIYAVIVGAVNLILFLPFIDNQLIQNMGSSVGLYFQKFEFNASFYYIIRQIGYWIWGYNIIGDAGKGLALLVLIGILWISNLTLPSSLSRWRGRPSLRRDLKKNNFYDIFSLKILLILTLYFALATTVHPWYITSLIMASVFTNFKYPILWSGLVFLTYFSYTTKPYQENLYLVFVEYLLVFGMMIWEVKKNRKWEIENKF
jgi:alpha-1,6-mannosyltransferase